MPSNYVSKFNLNDQEVIVKDSEARITATNALNKITDICTWWNGNTSTTAGDAVREQFSKTAIVKDKIFDVVSKIVAPYNDMNTFPINRYSWYAYSKGYVSNIPESINGPFTVLSYNASEPEQIAGSTQIIVEALSGKMFTRISWTDKYGATIWTNWSEISSVYSSITKGKIFTDSNIIAPYNDLNTFPNNKYSWYNVVQDVQNKPVGLNESFTILDYNASPNDQKAGSVQLCVSRSCTMWYRINLSNKSGQQVWTEWNEVPKVSKVPKEYNLISKAPVFIYKDINPPYNDLNTFPSNKYSWYNIVQDVQNKPVGLNESFTILDYNASPNDQKAGSVQLCVSRSCTMWYRINWSNESGQQVWTEWNEVPKVPKVPKEYNLISKAPVFIYKDINPPYNDLNTFPSNKYSWYNIVQDVQNKPVGLNESFTILDYNASPNDQKAGSVQLCVSRSCTMWYRINWSNKSGQQVWTEWNEVPKVSKVPKEYKNITATTRVRKPFDFAKSNVVFFGDSITHGNTSGTTVTQNTWPKQLNDKLHFASYSNNAVAGALFSPAYNSVATIQQQAESYSEKNATNIMFVAAGVNDWQMGVPLNTFASNVASFCEYVNDNYPQNMQVIFVTPIEQAGYYNAATTTELQEYRNTLTITVTEHDTFGRFSIVQGSSFGFPDKLADPGYISYCFGDKLHPTENGYKNLYVPGMLSAIV